MPEMLMPFGADTNGLGEDRLREDSVDWCGAEMADRLATLLHMPCLKNPYRHDLIDVTRSLHHRQLFGDVTKSWSTDRKQQLIDVAYHPYRNRIEMGLKRVLQQFTFVVHLSVRTFDLRQGDKLRRTDVGLMYDPSREDELGLCLDWINDLYDANPNLRVRRNYPRRGTVDCLTKAMRQRFPVDQYIGIEVWMNRAWAARKVRLREEAIEYFADALRETIGVPKYEAA